VAQTGERDQVGIRDPGGQQPGVARVHHPVGRAVQDQRAGADAALPQAACVASSGCRVRLPGTRVALRGQRLAVDDLLDECRAVRNRRRGQGVLDVAAQRLAGSESLARGDQPHRRQGHRIGERPARGGAGQDQPDDSVGVSHGEFLRDHAAEARAQHVCGPDPGVVKHGQRVTSHVRHAE